MLRRFLLIVPVFVSMVLPPAYSAPGDLDATFNPPNGFVTYDTGDYVMGKAVAIQSDGKILVVGDIENPSDWDVLVLRYNTDGSLDSGFGTDGVVTYDSGDDDRGWAVAIQSDGKIIVMGSSSKGTDSDSLLIRLAGGDATLPSSGGGGGGCCLSTL